MEDVALASDSTPVVAVDQLRALFNAEYARTVALAGLLGAHDPQDVAQEAFLRLHARLAGLRDSEAAVGYLRTTVVNLTRTALTRRAMKLRVLNTPGRFRPAAAEAPSAEDEAMSRLEPSQLGAAIRALPRAQREVIVLRYWLDLSLGEIAQTLNLPVGTVKSHVSRAHAALRTGLRSTGKDDE